MGWKEKAEQGGMLALTPSCQIWFSQIINQTLLFLAPTESEYQLRQGCLGLIHFNSSTSRNGTFKIIHRQRAEATKMIVLTRAAETNHHVFLAPCSFYRGPFHAPIGDLAMHRQQRCCCMCPRCLPGSPLTRSHYLLFNLSPLLRLPAVSKNI